jgi:O-antigen biosynthesis protein
MKPIIDVVVPCFRGTDVTLRCLRSVLTTRQSALWHLVIIDDASPEPALSVALGQLARDHPDRITLLTNATNCGFVVSTNRGMALHPDRDVLLLNSDATIGDEAFERLQNAAYRDDLIASVTAISNNASIASYPQPCVANTHLPADQTQQLAAAARVANDALAVEAPVGVGFCLYLRRAALAIVGPFDAERFGKGYGEEVDWCLRARAMGFRHHIAADVFVHHEGEASFGTAGAALREQAQAKVDAHFPSFGSEVQDYLKADPLSLARRRLDIARLALSSKPVILMVSHAWGGGVARHINDLVDLIAETAHVLELTPAGAHHCEMRWRNSNETLRLTFDKDALLAQLVPVLQDIGVDRLHFHHIHGLPQVVLDLPAVLDRPYEITLHDFAFASPTYHLCGPDGRYQESWALLDAPPTDRADHARWPMGAAQWRQVFAPWLAGASRIIAPSEDTRHRYAQIYPEVLAQRWQLLPHPDRPAPPAPPRLKVALLGGLSDIKGEAVLAATVTLAAEANDVEFVVLGYLSQTLPTYPEQPLHIRGGYANDAQLAELLTSERADVIWFPAQVPETYSYTLTVAMQSGLPIVASDLGALPERLASYPATTLVPYDAIASVWLARLRTAADAPKRGPAPPFASALTSADTYRRLLHVDLSRHQREADFKFENLSARLQPAPRAPELATAILYENGVLRGHTPSRQVLRSAIDVDARQIARLQESLTRTASDAAATEAHLRNVVLELESAKAILNRDVAQLAGELGRFSQAHQTTVAGYEAELARERSYIRRLEEESERLVEANRTFLASRSWRVTAPLRALFRLPQQVRAHTRRRFTQAATARNIVRHEGVLALVSRLRDRRAARLVAPMTVPTHVATATVIEPIALNTHAAPAVSIVIPVYGQHLLTYSLLRSIKTHDDGTIPVEVLVADDASIEPAETALESVTGVRFLRHPTNLGFLRNCNAAIAAARGETIVLLNNDTQVTAGWLTALLSGLDALPDVAIVGAKLIYPDGRLQEAGGIVWQDGSAWNYGRGDDPTLPQYNYLREVDYCSGAALAFRKQTFVASGGFDEHFLPAYCEDTDFCLRMRAAGKRVVYQPACTIVHFEGQSHGTDDSQGIKAHQVENLKKLGIRWRDLLADHRPNGVMPHLEKDRGIAQRILFVDATMLRPDHDSGSLRTFRLLALLRQMGHHVTFVADNLEYLQPYVGDLQAAGVEVLYPPQFARVQDVIVARGREYQTIVLARYYVANPLISVVRQHAPQARLVLDTVDLHFLRTQREMELQGKSKDAPEAQRVYRDEMAAIQACDAVIVVSPVEVDVLSGLLPRKSIFVVSNIHDLATPGPGYRERDGFYFVGGFRHPPNVDAVEWYAKEIHPHIRQALPGVPVYIIGSHAPARLTEWADDQLRIVGFVPDMAPYLTGCRVSIAPLRYGAGVKGKINQAMAHGVPVVGTRAAVEGMHLVDGLEALVADDAKDFADAMVQLYTDESVWKRLANAGRENIERHFSTDAAAAALQRVLGR